jgi:hypothetical protein
MRTPRPIWLTLPVALVAAGLAPEVLAQSQVTLARTLAPGARAKVTEGLRTELRWLYKDRGSAVGDGEVATVERRYVEEVRTAQPELLHRAFELSTRAKARSQDPKPERTSLHGRGVLVAGLEQKPDGPFELSKEDGEHPRWDRVIVALLPERPVARGESWTVSKEALVQALFGQFIPAATAEGSARVELRTLDTKKGTTRAGLRVRLQLAIPKTDQLPGMSYQLQGDLVFGVEAGRFLEARLEGPVAFTLSSGEGAVQAEGSIAWSLKAEPLEGRAPPSEAQRQTGLPPLPGTEHLVCEKDAAHRFSLAEFVRCIQCGDELDLTSRRCPKGHPWPLQYCPRDGAPLKAE